MKKILLSTFTLLSSAMMFGQVIADYNLLIVDGYGAPDAQTELTAMGHTATVIPATTLIAGYDYSAYDAILFMYDSPEPTSMSEIITLNQSCQLGIVLLRGTDVLTTTGMGTSVWYSSTAFTITNNTHFITNVFPLGLLDLGFTYKSNITASAPNTTVLGTVETANGSLVIHDTYKRVVSPYYGHSDGMPWTTDAATLLDRIVCWAADPCSTVGITSTQKKESNLLAYPNPSKGKFVVEASGDLTVMNVLGTTVHTQTLTEGAKEVDLTAMPTGIYFFQVVSNGTVLTKRLIKE